MKQFIFDRLREPSTWRGIILILTSAGVSIQPALADAIIGAGIGLAGVVGIVTADEPRAVEPEKSPEQPSGQPSE
jgi:hypothetical protein